MIDEQRKHIHDITYSTEDRMELAERIVALEDERYRLRELLAKREYDIERLRDLVSQSQADLEAELDCAERMEAKEKKAVGENAKLRELVCDMWRDIPKSESCGWDIDANCCTGSDECKGECSHWYRMRELGIEVEDA